VHVVAESESRDREVRSVSSQDPNKIELDDMEKKKKDVPS
jgi:hypothetical protein